MRRAILAVFSLAALSPASAQEPEKTPETHAFESRWSLGLAFSRAIPVGSFSTVAQHARGITAAAGYHAGARTVVEGSVAFYQGFSAKLEGEQRGTAFTGTDAMSSLEGSLIGGSVRMAAVGGGLTHWFVQRRVNVGAWANASVFLLRPDLQEFRLGSGSQWGRLGLGGGPELRVRLSDTMGITARTGVYHVLATTGAARNPQFLSLGGGVWLKL